MPNADRPFQSFDFLMSVWSFSIIATGYVNRKLMSICLLLLSWWVSSIQLFICTNFLRKIVSQSKWHVPVLPINVQWVGGFIFVPIHFCSAGSHSVQQLRLFFSSPLLWPLFFFPPFLFRVQKIESSFNSLRHSLLAAGPFFFLGFFLSSVSHILPLQYTNSHLHSSVRPFLPRITMSLGSQF